MKTKNYNSNNFNKKTEVKVNSHPLNGNDCEPLDIKCCSCAKLCGGCMYQGIPYDIQLSNKQQKVEHILGKFGHVNPIIGMNGTSESPFYYRNKVHHVISSDKKGQVYSAMYQENSHKLVRVDNCLIEDEISQQIISSVCKLAKSFKLSIYNENNDAGLIKHVLVRRGFKSGQIMVVLVLTSTFFPSKNNFIKELRNIHPEITTIVANINKMSDNMVLGDENIVLFGDGYIEDYLLGLKFRISPNSFYQINHIQTEKLYSVAINYAKSYYKSSTGPTIIDAYCGIGTIGLSCAAEFQHSNIIGAEINGRAIKDAIINAKINNISNAKFYKSDAGIFIEKMLYAKQSCDILFMDPPRSGSTSAFVKSLISISPKIVVYISCNPETQAYDLKQIVSGGYVIKEIQPIDMFPYTEHVETVCLLSKLDAKQHIEIDLHMDELNVTKAEKKATYQEIKDYVQENTGLHVSFLYIAQIKQKCGIIERDCYNKPKSENAKQPKCPPHKEKAIREALKHFGMI